MELYLLVIVQARHKCKQQKTVGHAETWCSSKVDNLCALHESFKSLLKQRQIVPKIGLPLATKHVQNLISHFLLASYTADFPETEDPMAIKQGSHTFTPRHACFAKR